MAVYSFVGLDEAYQAVIPGNSVYPLTLKGLDPVWQQLMTHVFAHFLVLACLTIVYSTIDSINGFPLAGSRILSRYIWLVFEIFISICRTPLSLLSLFSVKQMNQDYFDSLVAQIRPRLMANVYHADFWPPDCKLTAESLPPGYVSERTIYNLENAFSLQTAARALVETIRELVGIVTHQRRRLTVLEAEIARLCLRHSTLEGEHLVLRRKARNMAAHLERFRVNAANESASAQERRRIFRILLVSISVLWQRKRISDELLSRSILNTDKCIRQIEDLLDQCEDYMTRLDVLEIRNTALEIRLSRVEELRFRQLRETKVWRSVCRQVLTVRQQEVDRARASAVLYRKMMHTFLVYLLVLWRLCKTLRLRTIQLRPDYELTMALREDLEELQDLYYKQTELLAQSITRRHQELVRYKHHYRKTMSGFLTSLLVLWYLSRSLASRLALAERHITACPLSFLSSGMESAELSASSSCCPCTVGADSTLVPPISVAEPSAEQILAIRYGRLYEVHSSMLAQRDKTWVELQEALRHVDNLQEDQRIVVVALAMLYKFRATSKCLLSHSAAQLEMPTPIPSPVHSPPHPPSFISRPEFILAPRRELILSRYTTIPPESRQSEDDLPRIAKGCNDALFYDALEDDETDSLDNSSSRPLILGMWLGKQREGIWSSPPVQASASRDEQSYNNDDEKWRPTPLSPVLELDGPELELDSIAQNDEVDGDWNSDTIISYYSSDDLSRYTSPLTTPQLYIFARPPHAVPAFTPDIPQEPIPFCPDVKYYQTSSPGQRPQLAVPFHSGSCSPSLVRRHPPGGYAMIYSPA